MSELKITIDQLKNYLFTGLKISFIGSDELYDFVGLEEHYQGVMLHHNFNGCVRSELKFINLNCYRLSDLDKFIPELGFVPKLKLIELWSRYHKDSIKSMHQIQVHETDLYRAYNDIQKLFQWHFWPFGDEYFEAGLVIDKLSYNTPAH